MVSSFLDDFQSKNNRSFDYFQEAGGAESGIRDRACFSGGICLIGTVVYVAAMSSTGYAVGPAWNRVAGGRLSPPHVSQWIGRRFATPQRAD
jgi:hypothetical protein